MNHRHLPATHSVSGVIPRHVSGDGQVSSQSFFQLTHSFACSPAELEVLFRYNREEAVQGSIFEQFHARLLHNEQINPLMQRLYLRFRDIPGTILSLTRMICDEAIFYSGRISSLFTDEIWSLHCRKGKYFFSIIHTQARA